MPAWAAAVGLVRNFTDAGRLEHVADDGLLERLKVHVKEQAGAWKYPRWIDVRTDLPHTATGKIQRFKLRDEDLQAARAD